MVYDKNGKMLTQSDNVTYDTQVWYIERISGSKLHLRRFEVTVVVESNKVVRYR